MNQAPAGVPEGRGADLAPGCWPARRERWRATAGLLLILAAAYAPVFFGRSVVFTDNYNPLDYRPLAKNYGPNFVPASEWRTRGLHASANFHDPGATWWQWEPAAVFLREGLRRGELPFWDPYVGGGAPAFASLTPTMFYPPYLLMVLSGNTVVLKHIYFFTWLFAAAFCTYLFLRRHALRPAAAFFGATAVLVCGALNQNIGSFIGQAAGILPLALVVTAWFFDAPDARRMAWLGVACGALALASFPPVLIMSFATTGLYALVRCLLPEAGVGGHRGGALVRFAGAAAIAIGLVAWYYLPAIRASADAPQIAGVYTTAGLHVVPPVALLDFVAPVIAGAQKWSDTIYTRHSFGLILFYVGLVPLMALWLVPLGRRGPRAVLVWSMGLTLALMLMKILGVPPVQWVGLLPVLQTVHFSNYLGIPMGLVIAMLAAAGIDALLERPVPALRAAAVVASTEAVLFGILWVAKSSGVPMTPPEPELFWTHWWFAVGLAVLMALVVLAATRPIARRGWLAGLAIVLLTVQGLYYTNYPRQRQWDVWAHPSPYVQVLKARAHGGRVFTVGALPANTSSAFEVEVTDSLMTFNPGRAFELYRRYAAPDAYLFLRGASQVPPDGVLDAAAVNQLALRNAFAAVNETASARRYPLIYDDKYVRIFARPSEPRCYFTTAYQVADRAAALEAVAAVRPTGAIVLEERPYFVSDPGSRIRPVEYARWRRNGTTLRIDVNRPGFVYCADNFAPGWRASVNGQAARIWPANYAFRAVQVEAGASTVTFDYWPPGLTAGLAASGATAALLPLIALSDGRRGRRDAPAGGRPAP